MYQALILISASLSFSMAEYQEAVMDAVSPHQETPPTVSANDDGFTLVFSSGVEISAVYSCTDSVLMESKEIAEQFGANHQDRMEIAKAKCRIEVFSSPDYEMIHFNDFVTFVEVAERQGKIYAFDPQAGVFM